MAKTYKITGYMVDANGDGCNEVDIQAVLERYTDLFGDLNVIISPQWKFDDDCPENMEGCTQSDYEKKGSMGIIK